MKTAHEKLTQDRTMIQYENKQALGKEWGNIAAKKCRRNTDIP